ncbi:MAG: ribonuclease P protein component [Sedimentisphaerales bacterium]|nr:ribonuclease P protein component [Sedimentisphaerales bacterium]
MKRFSFTKSKRLVTNRQFKAILDQKRRLSNGLLTLYMAENGQPCWRLGISVGKSCGNAVKRNRLKRLLKEAFRQSQQQIPKGYDYLLMISNRSPRPKAKTVHTKKSVNLEEIKSSLTKLIDKAKKSDKTSADNDS